MADHTKYEFDDKIKRIQENLKDKPGWGQGYKSSSAQMILEGFVDAVDNLHYMLERRVQEQFLPSAKLTSSIYALANSLGYRPRRKVSAKGEVLLILRHPSGSGIAKEFVELNYYDIDLEEKRFVGSSDDAPDIPEERIISCDAWTEYNVAEVSGVLNVPQHEELSINGEPLVVLNNVSLFDGEFYKVFEIAEGKIEELEIDATSKTSSIFNKNFHVIADYEFIDNDVFNIYDIFGEYRDVRDRLKKEYYDSIGFANRNEKVYDLRISYDGLELLFGDGVSGAKPRNDIIVRYLKTKGSNFDIQSTGNDFSISGDLIDSGDNSFKYTCRNITPISGGLSEESVDQVKQRAPEYIRSGNRAVTKYDYSHWAKQSGVGGIIDAVAYSEEEDGLDVVQTNNIYITYVNKNYRKLRISELKKLQAFMDNYKIMTTIICPRLANKVDIKFYIKGKKRENINLSNKDIYNNVVHTTSKYFKYEEGCIGRDFYLSEFTKSLEELDVAQGGIKNNLFKWVDVDIIIQEYFSFDNDNIVVQLPQPVAPRELENYENGIELNYMPGSFKLYIKDGEDYNLIFEDVPDDEPLYTQGRFGDGNIIDYYFGKIIFNNLPEHGDYLIEYSQIQKGNIEINNKNVLVNTPFNVYKPDIMENYAFEKSLVEIL